LRVVEDVTGVGLGDARKVFAKGWVEGDFVGEFDTVGLIVEKLC
jgi:hypothetical protein